MNKVPFRRTIQILAGMGTISVLGFNTIPHIIPRKTIVPNREVPHHTLGERYERLLKEVCLEMNIDSRKIHLFCNNGFDTVSGGCLSFPEQSVIGLPRNCSLSTVEDVRKAPILFHKKSINWDSKIGKTLEDVLLISDEHVKFLMAHELMHIKNVDFVAMTLHATGFFVGTYFTGRYVGHTLMKGPWFHGILVQFVIWAIAFMLYRQTRRDLCHWMVYKADESAAHLGFEYSDGGVDCMRSRLKLNRVLRKLHGIEGEQIFSEVGDNLLSISTHPKRTDRLKRLKEIRKSFESRMSLE